MGRKSKQDSRKCGQPKNPRVYVGKFPNRSGADRALKKITDGLGEGALTITHRDGVEVWTIRKPTIS
jgi:acyl-CoA reductase-like NAD-dependent aldehyde dehydrogenase